MADQRTILGFPDVADENARDRLCRLVAFCDGWSLSNEREKLAALVGRGVDPDSLNSVMWKTNCGTSALGIIALTCGPVSAAAAVDAKLAAQSMIGTAISWIIDIGDRHGAWVTYKKDGPQPQHGDLMWYYEHPTVTAPDGSTSTKWDDHVEWLLEDLSSGSTTAKHGGGGREDNAITVRDADDVRTNAGRRLQKFFDLDKLNITPVAFAEPAAPPDAGAPSWVPDAGSPQPPSDPDPYEDPPTDG